MTESSLVGDSSADAVGRPACDLQRLCGTASSELVVRPVMYSVGRVGIGRSREGMTFEAQRLSVIPIQ